MKKNFEHPKKRSLVWGIFGGKQMERKYVSSLSNQKKMRQLFFIRISAITKAFKPIDLYPHKKKVKYTYPWPRSIFVSLLTDVRTLGTKKQKHKHFFINILFLRAQFYMLTLPILQKKKLFYECLVLIAHLKGFFFVLSIF